MYLLGNSTKLCCSHRDQRQHADLHILLVLVMLTKGL